MTTAQCPECRNPVSPGLTLCSICGAALWGLAPSLPAPEPPPPPPIGGTGWVCPTCQRPNTGPECPFDGTPDPTPRRPASVLTVRLPDGSGIPLAENEPLDLGRHSPNQQVAAALRVYDGVSRRHATLTVSGGQATVIDHQSANGTRLNGIPVVGSSSVPLSTASTIHLGRHAVIHLSQPST